jgi:hypothetical protein
MRPGICFVIAESVAPADEIAAAAQTNTLCRHFESKNQLGAHPSDAHAQLLALIGRIGNDLSAEELRGCRWRMPLSNFRKGTIPRVKSLKKIGAPTFWSLMLRVRIIPIRVWPEHRAARGAPQRAWDI